MAGTRYVRYIVLAVICLVVIFFISSSSSGPAIEKGSSVVHSQYDKIMKGLKPPNTADRHSNEKLLKDPVNPEPVDHVVGASEHPSTGGDKSSKDASTNKGNDPSRGEKQSKESKLKDNKPYTGGKASKEGSDKIPSKKPPNEAAPNIQGGLTSAKSQESKMNATFVTLARNSDVWEISKSIRQVEDRFNHRFNYDWVFLNDKEFDEDFKRITTNLVSGKTRYGQISEEHWSFPDWIDQEKAAEVRKDMAERKIIYGDSISYRHMCRYESGFFFRHPLMLEYEWYWRVEPSVELYCDIEYDTFRYMAEHNKKYSFVLSLYEYKETIPTMWDSVRTFMKEHPEHLAKGNALDFLSDDGGKTYNHCHFWSNFEIGNLDWLRSEAYIDFFDRLDKDGGFFYERWGDAPVHSIGAGLLLPKDQIHFFNDIAYYHVPFTHCPTEEKVRIDRKCSCNPKDNFDWQGYSCTSRWFDINNMKKPKGYEELQG